jgi:hypothetical protein
MSDLERIERYANHARNNALSDSRCCSPLPCPA